jgi:hypothetical protein
MVRPMPSASFAPAGTCPACRHRFAGDDEVLRTNSGAITCIRHRRMFVAEAVVWTGRYADRNESAKE